MDSRHQKVANALLGLPDNKTNAYHLALGRFIAEYATVEAELRALLWSVAGVKEPIAQAIMSGVRTEDGISLIYRVLDAKKWSEQRKARFKYLFDQIQAINKLRNDIVHRGASLQADGSWLSTNKTIAHIPERITNTVVSPDILDFARSDLFNIRIGLVFLKLGRRAPPPLNRMADEALKDAWRYIPAPQGRKASTNRQTPQKPTRPPRSSRA